MFRPKIIEFPNGESLRIEYWWFKKGKIFPRYHPTFILSGKAESLESDQVKHDASIKDVLRFLFSNE